MAGNMKIWIGVGAFVMSTGGLAGCADKAAQEPVVQAQASAGAAQAGGEGGEASYSLGHGGEGGEGGEGGGGPVDTDEELLGALMMMRGHLYAADELYQGGRKQEAVAHFYHPTAEVYESVRATLERRQVPHFDADVNALGAAASSQADAKVRQGYQTVQQRIDAAAASIPEEKRNSPQFLVPVVVDVLKQATHEYEEAVREGKFVNVAEYQDGFGFARVAQQTLESIRPQLQASNAQAYQEVQAQLEAMLQAWPGAVPPAQPTLSVSELFGALARLELAAQGLR